MCQPKSGEIPTPRRRCATKTGLDVFVVVVFLFDFFFLMREEIRKSIEQGGGRGFVIILGRGEFC